RNRSSCDQKRRRHHHHAHHVIESEADQSPDRHVDKDHRGGGHRPPAVAPVGEEERHRGRRHHHRHRKSHDHPFSQGTRRGGAATTSRPSRSRRGPSAPG